MWKTDKKNVNQRHAKHYKAITACIETACEIHRSSLAQETMDVATTATTTDNAVPTPSPPKPKEREIKLLSNPFRSNGKDFCYDIPHDHVVVHRDHLKRWQNDSWILWRIRAKLQAPNCSTNDLFSQSLWGISMACVPALALSAAQHLMPLIVMAFFHDTGLFNCAKFDRDKFATSFPSDWSLRKFTVQQATRDTMTMSKTLAAKKVYTSCDK